MPLLAEAHPLSARYVHSLMSRQVTGRGCNRRRSYPISRGPADIRPGAFFHTFWPSVLPFPFGKQRHPVLM